MPGSRFFMAYILAFYLAYILAYIPGILSAWDIYSGILPGVYSNVF